MVDFAGGYAAISRESKTRTTSFSQKPFEHVVVIPLTPFLTIFGERLLLAQKLLGLGKEIISEWSDVYAAPEMVGRRVPLDRYVIIHGQNFTPRFSKVQERAEYELQINNYAFYWEHEAKQFPPKISLKDLRVRVVSSREPEQKKGLKMYHFLAARDQDPHDPGSKGDRRQEESGERDALRHLRLLHGARARPQLLEGQEL